jgi:hypothetical protein
MITLIHNFNNVLLLIWFIGGILLLPFNSVIVGSSVAGIYKIEQDRWWQICRPIWALQMVWNLVFFSISLSLGYTEKEQKAKEITYTLTRGRPHLYAGVEGGSGEYAPKYSINPDEWDWHFYRQTAKGKKEIDDLSEEATPFQKAINDNTFHMISDDPDNTDNTSLPYQGLHVSSRSSNAEKWFAFDHLPYEEATAYIDHLNTTRTHEYTITQDILYSLLLAVVLPFFPFLLEVLGPPFLFMCLLILGKNKLLGMLKK